MLPREKGWELITLSHCCDKVYPYKSYGRRDITFLICHVVSPDHIVKVTCDLASGIPQLKLPSWLV